MREPWLLIAVIWSLGTVVIWLLWGLTAATWFVAVPVLLLVLLVQHRAVAAGQVDRLLEVQVDAAEVQRRQVDAVQACAA